MLIFVVVKIVLGYKYSGIKDSVNLYGDDALFGKYATLKLGGDYEKDQALYSVSVMLGNPAEEFDLLLEINSHVINI